MNKAIFLDRDGVINNHNGYVNCLDDFHILPKVKDALLLLKQAGYKLIVITNQGGIEKGYMTEMDLLEIHDYMLEKLPEIDDINYCGNYHSFNRKPSPGMIYEMALKHKINVGESWFIGDMETDIQCGINAGCKGTALIVNNIQQSIKCSGKATFMVDSLYQASIEILTLEGYLT